MNREKVKDLAFGLGAISSVVLIGAAILGAFLTTETFVTQYSVLAGRSGHYHVAGR
jgi:hypothetical protein